MNLKTRATQVGEEVRVDINSSDNQVLNSYYIDIKEIERLKNDLIMALQDYDDYLLGMNKAANDFMEEG